MSNQKKHLCSAPGRICLFGEHQDYLGLPIIATAISKRFFFEGQLRDDNQVNINMKDLREVISIDLNNHSYYNERDYLRSSIAVLRNAGYEINRGLDATGWSEIPIASGVSSSTAMVISWISLLLSVHDYELPPPNILAEYAYQAEVLEFNEPGGRMDHYSIALGGTIHMKTVPSLIIEKLPSFSGDFVLVQSGEPKDTHTTLRNAKERRIKLIQKIRKDLPKFDWHSASNHCPVPLSDQETELYEGTIRNRDILQEALTIMKAEFFNAKAFGEKLAEHQSILSRILKVSTDRIDENLEICMAQGALGGKIVGSGGGGCFIVYAPGHTEHICKIMEVSGLKAWQIDHSEGVDIRLT